MTREYDEIIGLGYDCRLAFNLRRTFGDPRAFPFDWWVTPLPGLIAFLEDPSVDALYDPKWLAPHPHSGPIHAIRNIRYDIELHHEFPRGPDGAVVADWLQRLDQPRARTDYLLRRMLSVAPESRILFVRTTKKSEGRELGERFPVLIGEVRQALQALYPKAQIELLLIDPQAKVRAHGVTKLRIDDRNRSDWRGTPELWTERLMSTGINWSGKPAQAPIDADPDADQAAAPTDD